MTDMRDVPMVRQLPSCPLTIKSLGQVFGQPAMALFSNICQVSIAASGARFGKFSLNAAMVIADFLHYRLGKDETQGHPSTR